MFPLTILALWNLREGRCPAAQKFLKDRQELFAEAQESLNKAARRMKKNADRGRRELEFRVGDMVILKLTPQIWKRISAKTAHRGLIPRYDGPFKVLERIGEVAYKL